MFPGFRILVHASIIFINKNTRKAPTSHFEDKTTAANAANCRNKILFFFMIRLFSVNKV